MNDRSFQSATALAAALRRRDLGARELLEHFVQRVQRHNASLNAVVTLDVERARTAADAADAEAARGAFRGPLHGLPVTIKDTYETAGLRTTAGAKIYAQHVPSRNAVAVQRLIDAGAIVFGKTNSPAFAADVQTFNEIFGVTNNPWDRTRTPGGSSGGGAAAVATGLTAFELGSDIGGSIRIPANNCGVYGHKSTYGIVPARGHIPSPPGSLAKRDISVVGPLARSAEDLDLLLATIAGPLADEAVAWRLALPPARHRELGEYRIAAWLDEPGFPVDNGVRDTLQNTVDALRRRGARVDERARPGFALAEAFDAFLRVLWPVTVGNLPDAMFEGLCQRAAQSAPDDNSPPARHARYSTVTHREWLRAHEARERYRAAWHAFFEQYDVLLTPVSPVPAIPHNDDSNALARTILVNGEPRWYWEQQAWISLAGLSYLPATAAPVGLTGGLPVGMQIIGPYLEDRTTIDFAKKLADVAGGFKPPPDYV